MATHLPTTSCVSAVSSVACNSRTFARTFPAAGEPNCCSESESRLRKREEWHGVLLAEPCYKGCGMFGNRAGATVTSVSAVL